MKKSIITIGVLLSLLATAEPASNSSREQTADQLVQALRSTSADAYAALYPSLNDFHNVMNKHAIEYGPFLQEAKQDFALKYDASLAELKSAFQTLIQEGKKKGISWKDIELINVDVTNKQNDVVSTASMTLVFSNGGKTFSIEIADAMFVNEKWYVSRHIRFL